MALDDIIGVVKNDKYVIVIVYALQKSPCAAA